MTPVTAPFDKVLNLIKNEIENPTVDMAVVERLLEIGYAALVRAAESKETGNITLNQMEAFACAVYFNGKKIRTKFLDKAQYRGTHYSTRKKADVDSAEPDPKRGRMGRSMALHELRDHKSDTNGYELYLTNAMWYSAIHEKGWTMRNGKQHEALRIITQEIIETVGEIERDFGVSVYVDVWYNGQK